MFKLQDIKPSKEAIAKAEEMGREAAKNDKHMQPCPEDHVDENNVDDIGAISEEHKDSWCRTDHFQHHYGTNLSDLADDEEERITGEIGGLASVDLGYYEGLYIPLRDAFFEAWEANVDFYEKAEAAIAEYKANK